MVVVVKRDEAHNGTPGETSEREKAKKKEKGRWPGRYFASKSSSCLELTSSRGIRMAGQQQQVTSSEWKREATTCVSLMLASGTEAKMGDRPHLNSGYNGHS